MKFRVAMRYPPLISLVNAVVRARTFAGAMDDAAGIVDKVADRPIADCGSWDRRRRRSAGSAANTARSC